MANQSPAKMMTVLRIFGWLVAAATSLWVAASSYAISNQLRAPARSVAIGVPPAGIAEGGLALLSFAARRAEDPKISVNDMERRFAVQSYEAEPLAISSLGLLTMTSRLQSDPINRQQLLELAGKLSRRNVLVSTELINSAAARNDDKDFFLWLSRVVSVDNRVRRTYVTAMAEATARDGAVEALTPVIGPSPGWSEYYWNLVAQRPKSLVNAANLRIAVAKRPWLQNNITLADQQLVRNLIKIRQFELANQLAAEIGLHLPARDNAVNLLANADFSHQPALPPLDWELAALGNLGSTLDEQKKSLFISALGGARGIAARQLVRLGPGNYSFEWSLTNESQDKGGGEGLSLQLQCAENLPNVINPPSVPLLGGGKRGASVFVADDRCQWYWFSIVVAVPDDAAGIDIHLHYLSFKRVERSSAGPA